MLRCRDRNGTCWPPIPAHSVTSADAPAQRTGRGSLAATHPQGQQGLPLHPLCLISRGHVRREPRQGRLHADIHSPRGSKCPVQPGPTRRSSPSALRTAPGLLDADEVSVKFHVISLNLTLCCSLVTTTVSENKRPQQTEPFLQRVPNASRRRSPGRKAPPGGKGSAGTARTPSRAAASPPRAGIHTFC